MIEILHTLLAKVFKRGDYLKLPNPRPEPTPRPTSSIKGTPYCRNCGKGPDHMIATGSYLDKYKIVCQECYDANKPFEFSSPFTICKTTNNK